MEALSNDLLPRLERQPLHTDGEVCGSDHEGLIRVRTADGEVKARRAASCLVWPDEGDRVLVSGVQPDALFIIAVLEHRSASPLRLAMPGETVVTVADGAGLSLDLEGELALRSRSRLQLQGEELLVHAGRATLVCRQLKTLARDAFASLRNARLVGTLLEATVERVRLLAGHSERRVQGLDLARSGSMDYGAEQTVQLHGQNLLASAEKLVKVDGDQIHLG